MITWVGYCVLVSCVLGAGAALLESAARASGRAGRWGWIAALCGSLVFPLLSYLRPVHVTASASSIALTQVSGIAAQSPAGTVSTVVPVHPGLLLWATASLLVVAFIVLSCVCLMRARRAWTVAHMDGSPVWISNDVGPAALGLVNTGIVLPRWVLSLEERARALMLLHEREHLRAWDPRVLLGCVMLVALMPWNPVLWLMVRRIRLAIELDCDARVLTRDPDPAAYGAVLLEVSRRRARNSFALSTFAEPRSQLEERIRRMSQWPGNRHLVRAAALSVLALSLSGAAYAVRGPLHARVVVDPVDGAGIEERAAQAPRDTVRPRLANEQDVRREISRSYPPLLRDAGIESVTTIMVFVDATGQVKRSQIHVSSGYEPLDKAALIVGAAMKFTPASVNGRNIGMWMAIDVPFTTAGTAPKPSSRQTPPKPAPPVIVDRVLRSSNEMDTVRVVDAVGRVSGIVTKAGTPLANAHVVVSGGSGGGSTSVYTDQDGRYVVDRAPTNSTTISVQAADGSASMTRPVRVVGATSNTIDLEVTPRVQVPRAQNTLERVAPLRDTPASGSGEALAEAGPVFTPMTVPPKLMNKEEVEAAVAKNYPPLLRNAGIGGKTKVWFLIDETGRTVKVQVNTPSGYDALDAAALRVAPVLRFTPAENRGVVIPVWVAIDIVFKIN